MTTWRRFLKLEYIDRIVAPFNKAIEAINPSKKDRILDGVAAGLRHSLAGARD